MKIKVGYYAMLGKLLCKFGLHNWALLDGKLLDSDDDFLLRYCLRCGKMQEARYTGRLDRWEWGESNSLERWRRRASS